MLSKKAQMLLLALEEHRELLEEFFSTNSKIVLLEIALKLVKGINMEFERTDIEEVVNFLKGKYRGDKEAVNIIDLDSQVKKDKNEEEKKKSQEKTEEEKKENALYLLELFEKYMH